MTEQEKKEKIEIKKACLDYAINSRSSLENNADDVIKDAKKFEEYLDGKSK